MEDSPYLTDNDALMWAMERDRRLRGTATTLLVLDRPIEWARLVAVMDRMTRLQPRFRQRVVETPFNLAPPRWVVDDEFDLGYHLRRMGAPTPGDLRAVADLAATFSMAAFDHDRPLWEYTLVEGMADGRCVLIQKVHHAIADGLGGMEMALEFFDEDELERDKGPLPPAPEPEHVSTLELVRDGLVHRARRVASGALAVPGAVGRSVVGVTRDPLGAARRTAEVARGTADSVRPTAAEPSALLQGRGMHRYFDTIELPLDQLRRAAKATGSTVNDVYLASLAEGMERYHRRHDADLDVLRVAIPVSIRRVDDPAAGNRVTTVRVELEFAGPEMEARIADIHERLLAARHEAVSPMTEVMIGVFTRLPPVLLTAALGSMLFNVDLLASNVPGFSDTPYVAGAAAVEWYAFGPTEGTAVNATMMSHAGRVFVGIAVDTAAVVDPEVLVDCLREGFDRVEELAG